MNSQRGLNGIVLCLACLVIFSARAVAQTSAATLVGTVTDPSGAVVAGAIIELINVDTNVTQAARSNQGGLYSFASVSPGPYRIEVKHPGFKSLIETGLTLHVGDTVSQNFRLELGATTESITVSGDAVAVNTEDGTVGTVVERQVIANMPLNGRSFQGLIELTPGIAAVVSSGASTNQFVVNGQRSDTSYFMVDGVSANVGSPLAGSLSANGAGAAPTNSATGGYNTMVSVDALQEFKVSTSNFAPEFGRTPGAQISMVSRSGTNAFHGDVFDYFRNTVLDANDWFLNAANKARGVVQQNDFGGVFGGPIKKDKLFFFVSYEGLRLHAPTPAVKQVPTQAARTLAAAANSGGVTGYMAQFANAYPLPDGNPGTPCTTFANCTASFSGTFPTISSLDSTGARADYSIGKNMTLFGRYAHSPSSLTVDNSVTATSYDHGNDVYTAGWTWIPGISTNNDLRFNFTHSTTVRSVIPLKGAIALSAFFPSGYAQPPSTYAPSAMSLQISGLPTDAWIMATANANNGNNQRNITDNFSWVKGSHRFKFGGDFRQLDPSFDQSNYNNNNQFAQNTTALPGFPVTANVCPVSALPAGSSSTVPGYICGQATLSNLQHNFVQHFRYRQFSFFAQDTWKISHRLTVTYGVRWDINPAIAFTSNNPGFSIQRSSFNTRNVSNININQLGTAPFPTTWTDLAPRAGVAYRLSENPKWGRVLRAGYGIFYDTGSQAANSLSTPFNARFNNIGAGVNAPTVQFPISNANSIFVSPPTPRLTVPVSNGGTDILIDPNFNLPYVHQFNVSLEQQLGRQQTLTASYVGALGRRLIGLFVYPPNLGNPAVFAQINPITGAVTADALEIQGNYSSSDYHALQAKLQRRFANGLSALVSYTWSHSMDDTSINSIPSLFAPTAGQVTTGRPIALLRASSDFDIRQILALSLVYEIPSPRNHIARAFLGHWSVDPIYHYQTPPPLDVLTGNNVSLGASSYSQRPNLIPGVPVYVYGSDCQTQNGGKGCPGGVQLNTAPVSASAAASAGCVVPTATNAKGALCTPALVGTQAVSGNLGRNAIRGFALRELDLSLHREFPIHEATRLRFQVDMFNAFNQPNFGSFGTTVNGTTFGTTTSMANNSLSPQFSGGQGFNPIFNTGGPRNFQFALKLFF
jgi:hypothetical protein